MSKGLVLDLFAGAEGISKACHKAGFKTRSYDIQQGPSGDLTDRDVLQGVVQLIEGKRVVGVFMGTPCTTFSGARDRNSRIRSRRFPWGLPDLPERLQAQVLQGNRLARATLRILRACLANGTPAVLENPATSRLFLLPGLRRIMSSACAAYHIIDLCQYGASWRKPTGLLFLNYSAQAIEHFVRPRCTPQHGICSKTKRKHIVLSGNAPEGIPWTRAAQVYPQILCKELSLALIRTSLV